MDDTYYNTTADEDFLKARRRAQLESLFTLALGKRADLISLDEARDLLKPSAESFRGVQTIEVAKIVGSEGRYTDFTQRFMPLSNTTTFRWRRVHIASQKSIELPAIQVYELGGYYFVRDGNHRVSVARQVGRSYLEAHVTELTTEVELGDISGIDDLKKAVLDYERKRFLESLGTLELDSDISFTTTGRFDDLAIHIGCHRAAMSEATGQSLGYAGAAESWYRAVYRPITQLIRDSGVLQFVPDRTESDFYVWLVRQWDAIATPPDRSPRRGRKLRRDFAKQVG